MTAKPSPEALELARVFCATCHPGGSCQVCEGIAIAMDAFALLREEELLLCVHGIKHWIGCDRNLIGSGSGIVCDRCQREDAESRLARTEECLRETRDAAAHLCRIIVKHGLTHELDARYDGFGKRADALLAENKPEGK